MITKSSNFRHAWVPIEFTAAEELPDSASVYSGPHGPIHIFEHEGRTRGGGEFVPTAEIELPFNGANYPRGERGRLGKANLEIFHDRDEHGRFVSIRREGADWLRLEPPWFIGPAVLLRADREALTRDLAPAWQRWIWKGKPAIREDVHPDEVVVYVLLLATGIEDLARRNF